MFTGIIQSIGEIAAIQLKGGDVRLYIKTGKLQVNNVALGDSIATNGVCLTAVELPGDGFWADVSRETLDCTSVGNWKVGQAVNLEKAMTPETHFGGHIVSGHVDGLGEIVTRKPDGRSERFVIRAPKELAKYIAANGSITIAGVSLTVNRVDGCDFEINIVPHTLQETIIGGYKKGTKINWKVDVVARYRQRLMLGDKAAEEGECGYAQGADNAEHRGDRHGLV